MSRCNHGSVVVVKQYTNESFAFCNDCKSWVLVTYHMGMSKITLTANSLSALIHKCNARENWTHSDVDPEDF